MSKNCPVKDIKVLKWEYSMPEFLKLKEYVEMVDSLQGAAEKDQEIKSLNSK